MSKRWFLMVILLMFALPSVLHAAGMGGMVFEVYLPTSDVRHVDVYNGITTPLSGDSDTEVYSRSNYGKTKIVLVFSKKANASRSRYI